MYGCLWRVAFRMSTIRARLLDNPELWLVAVVVLVLGPFVQAMTAQPAARYALTGAIWEHHTVDVGRYPVLIDRATLENGELRSDKAPGQPLLAVPAFALGRLVGIEPATHPRFAENLGLWWVTLFSTVLPLALLAVLLRRVALGLGSTAPTIVALVIVFGTTIADIATQLFGHTLAALFAYGAWYVLRGAARDRRAPWVVGGLLAGCAVITEYTTFLIALVLTVFVLWRARERFLWFALGALPAAAVGAIYDQDRVRRAVAGELQHETCARRRLLRHQSTAPTHLPPRALRSKRSPRVDPHRRARRRARNHAGTPPGPGAASTRSSRSPVSSSCYSCRVDGPIRGAASTPDRAT